MLKRSLIEGLKNVTRSFWLSATAISVITVSLASVALVASLSSMLSFTLRQFNNQITILAYFKEDVDPATIQAIQDDFRNLPEVRELRYVDREQAREEFAASNQASPSLVQTLQNADQDLVLEYLEIIPTDPDAYRVVDSQLRDQKYAEVLDDIVGSQEFIDQLRNLYWWSNILVAVGVTIFGLISILVLINILRIAIYNRRDEIEIMRLVGATNSYIRGPFIAEGMYFILFSALIVVILFVPMINLVLPYFEQFFQLQLVGDTSQVSFQIYLSLLATIIVGVGVGVTTAYIATRRYLKL